jgi:RNA polymerase sigma-70 factor (ECF subfamily)
MFAPDAWLRPFRIPGWMQNRRTAEVVRHPAARSGNGAEGNVAADGDDASPGFEEEFQRLFERYFRSVFHFFLNRGMPREECFDLTQETFLRVYRGIRRFRRDASVQTWLFQIATNLWLNAVRRRMAEKREGKEVSLESAVESGHPIRSDRHLAGWSEPAGPLEGMLDEERRRMLREAMAELPPQMQRCLLLRIDQNLKYREIAGVMRISIDTVKSQLSQARDRLEQKLGRYFGPLEF